MAFHRAYIDRIGLTLLLSSVSTLAVAQEISPAADEIVVTGQRAQQQRAIALKRDALGIIDVSASDEIGRLPDRNVAEVVERLPGVGVTYDQGEGRYVAVRGVPSNLNNYTVNGIEIGNPDGLGRALPLDVISGQLLNRVEVVKAKTADLDAQGIGGSINLVTQTAYDFTDRFVVQATAQAGYQELNDKVPVRGDASIGGRFGADEQFGLLVGASYSNRTYASYGLYPDDWRPVEGAPRGGLPINTKFTDYELERERIGATGSFDWRPNDDHQFYLRGLYSKFTENEYRQRYRLDFATDAVLEASDPARGSFVINPDGVTGTASGTAIERRQDLRLEYKEKSVLAGMIGGSSRFDALKVDYVLARVHNEVREPNQLWQFRGNPGTVDFDFSDKIFSAVPRTELTPAQLQFRQYSEQYETGDEDIWQGRVDLSYDLVGLDEGSALRFGGKYRATDKNFDASNDSWTRGSTAATRFTLGQFDLQGRPVDTYPDNGDRAFRNGPTIDADKIRDFTSENLSGPLFVVDQDATVENATLSDFDLDENVAAAYVMADLRFGNVALTPGLRYERTRLDIRGFALDDDNNITPVSGRARYDDWLPSLIVRFTPRSDLVFRAAYTRSLGRPEYSDLAPGGRINAVDETLSIGNPDLKPYRAHNLDASAEWYFARGGLLSVGAFAKFIDNPIFSQAVTQTNVSYGGQTYSRLRVTQPLNADKGEIIGIEASYQQQFTFLPGLLSGLGIELNGTLIDSSLRTPDGRKSDFLSQSRYLYGAQLFYQRGRVEASLAFHNTGKSLLARGSDALTDQYNDDLRRLDAKASVRLTDNMTVFAEAQNLTDEPTRQYQGERRDWVIQNERYGRTFYAGVSLSW